MPDGRLAGKVALVTGSTRGIGRAIALRFAAEGASVVVVGRSTDDGDAVVTAIRDGGGRAVYARADVMVEADVQAAVATASSAFGRLDVLVNNAAATDLLRVGPDRADAAAAELTTAAWEAILRGGVTSAFWACHHAMPVLAATGGGSIVSISTGAAIRAVAGMAGHSASKAALEALTRSVAADGAPLGIRANSLVLGFISDSGGHAALLEEPARAAALQAMHLTRMGTVDDVAAAALFLASDEAGFVTGVSLPLDGGSSVRLG